MRPEEWLKSTALVKVTSKLPDWSREDLIQLAIQEFKVMDLSKVQLIRLISKLKEGCPKPIKTVELKQAIEAKSPTFKMVPNRGSFSSKTQWEWAGKSPALRFGNVEDLTAWATDQIMKDTTRGNWGQVLKEWYNKTHMRSFDPGLWPAPMHESCKAAYTKAQGQVAKQLIPLPDNDTISRRYWSLSPGDRLTNEEGCWEVSNVKLTMDGPPVLRLEKVLSDTAKHPEVEEIKLEAV